MKGIEGYPNRESNCLQRDELRRKKMVDRFSEEIEILEITKQQQVQQDRCGCYDGSCGFLLCAADPQTAEIIQRDRKQQQYDEFRFTPCVKDEAHDEQKQVTPLFTGPDRAKKHDREKDPQKRE